MIINHSSLFLLSAVFAATAKAETYVSTVPTLTNQWCNTQCNWTPPNCVAGCVLESEYTPEPPKKYYRVYPHPYMYSDPNEEDTLCSEDCNHVPEAMSCYRDWHCIELGQPNPHTFYKAIHSTATDEWCYDTCNHIPPDCPADYCEGIPNPSTPTSPVPAPTAPAGTPTAPNSGGTPTNPNPTPSGSLGDPHFKTWNNEHFEYHGQCDLMLTKDPQFADGLGMDVQIRTKLVRFWSYIKQASIRIGEDILELEGAAEPEKNVAEYWINLEYQGELTTVGGFPVILDFPSNDKRRLTIDLSSKYPGVTIEISSYKEFVRVEFIGSTEEAFGNTVGLLGDFKTGTTFARDGRTEISDFYKLGNEWQVLPVENMLFHDVSEPQFPRKCIEPEDPRGDRRRRLGEETVSEEEAEKACAALKDPLDRKDCVYDILATQDIEMVGAF